MLYFRPVVVGGGENPFTQCARGPSRDECPAKNHVLFPVFSDRALVSEAPGVKLRQIVAPAVAVASGEKSSRAVAAAGGITGGGITRAKVQVAAGGGGGLV